MRPLQTLAYILGVFLLLSGVMLITPKNGVEIGGFTFHMPTLKEMLVNDKVEYADLSDIINQQFEIDSLVEFEVDTLMGDTLVEVIHRANYDTLVQRIQKLEMNRLGRENLEKFFYHLQHDSLTRIMHYGDSQIEGDRITSFVRNKLQVRFGGTGVGLRPALQPYDYVFSANQFNSENWKRYPIYGAVDSTITHSRYGVMGAFSRYAPLVPDSVPFTDSTFYEAEMTVSKSDISYRKTREYDYMRLFYGNTRRPVKTVVIARGDTVLTDSLQADIDYAVLECALPDSTESVTIKFTGYDGPDVYGIELASQSGVIMDNIALRGSSGTIFTKADYEHSLKMYNDLHPSLFILQFGGNVVPYIQSSKAIKRYGRYFGSQIKRIKELCPEAAILVIGPSDMSTKEKDKYVTYAHLPELVATLREVTVTSGCAYWDMYTAMGGYNSMPSWVNADPELARPDYVHFSAKGARLVANMFYNSLMFEYNNYLEEARK
ncbi:GDSL-type esterase/lipase family protein [Maribellus sediminis]|uniref:GDSL-type esterase/lipase family protein n=1 Tax=Maribellus sediminis TaxID=2696285 RepID=UPI00143021D3|nr:GDSL-type esterase/lipase family protein [Maribellus sediminis]